jgi:hypothetical protein
MDMDEVLERHNKYIKPYLVYFFILEFIVIPVGAVLAGYLLGRAGWVSAMVIGYLAADILVIITRGRTLLTSIKIAWIAPWKMPYSHVLTIILKTLFMLMLIGIAIFELIKGQLFPGLATLSLVALAICFIAARRIKQYERPLWFVLSLLLLAMVLFIALNIENPVIRLFIFLLALVWGFFVALGAYNLLIRKRPVQA